MGNMMTDGVMGSRHNENNNKNERRNSRVTSDKCRKCSGRASAVLSIKKTAEVMSGVRKRCEVNRSVPLHAESDQFRAEYTGECKDLCFGIEVHFSSAPSGERGGVMSVGVRCAM